MNDLFQCTCPHCGQDMPNAVVETSFAAFWAKVPHKINKASAEKAWRKLGKAHRLEAERHVKAFYEWFAKTYAGASPLHPATYLNNMRWQDEGVIKADVSQDALISWIKQGLQSTVPSVVEHATKMAEKNGIDVTAMRVKLEEAKA